ncbi:MAG: hypothetical protein ABFD07_01640 [Methanobacterium sp.]
MKHLRKFNESRIDNLKDLCEANFAYLLDDGYELNYHATLPNYRSITLQKEVGFFRWSEVKDYYLSFIKRIQNDYELSPMQKYSKGEKIVTNYIKVLTQKNERTQSGFPSANSYEYYNIDEIEQADLDMVWFITIIVKI